MINQLYEGDCLEIMKDIPDKSINMILCDLPYQITGNCKWDVLIPFDRLWEQYDRICKDNTAICLFAAGMFMSDLMQSNRKYWRYNLIWDKVLPVGFLNAKKMPMRSHEDIVIFYKNLPTYNPQMTLGEKCHVRGKNGGKGSKTDISIYQKHLGKNTEGNLKYPKSIITIKKDHSSIVLHPTQKPVDLFEYLIKTYTNEGDLVLDNCAGSGTTAIACLNTNRNYILIEKELKYCSIIKKRISEHNEAKSK
jgi:site-specific DNA-methyltransferase (adenine-specific)